MASGGEHESEAVFERRGADGEPPQNIRFTDSMEKQTSQQRDSPIVEEKTEDGYCTFTVCPMLRLRLDIGHQWLQCTEQARAG